MVYQFRYLHVFMSLFFFYVMACLFSVSIYLLIAVGPLYFEIMTNSYVWMLYAPAPLFAGMSLSLFFAGVVQWLYRCKIDGEKFIAKDTWGREMVVDPEDVTSVHNYEVPFMPLSRITVRNARWSVWIPKSVVSEIIKTA